MQINSIQPILASFSPDDWNLCEAYFSTPLFCTKPQLKKIFVFLKGKYVKHQPYNMPKQYHIWKALYPHEPYEPNKARLRNHLGKFIKHLNDYLKFAEYRRDENNQALYLLNALQRRKLPSLFNKHEQQLSTKLKAQTSKDAPYWRQYYEKEAIRIRSLTKQIQVPKQIPYLLHSLDNDYLITKLSYLCKTLSNQTYKTGNIPQTYLLTFKNYLSKSPLHTNPILEIFYYMYCALISQSEKTSTDNYFSVKLCLDKQKATNFENIHTNVKDIYLFANNFCIKKANQGYHQYDDEISHNYETMLHYQLLNTEQGYINPIHFKNIILTVSKYDTAWVSNFTNNFENGHYQLHPAIHPLALLFAKGVLYFYQHDYPKAVEHLEQTTPHQIFKISSHFLLLKSYYKLQQEKLFSASNKLKKNLKKHPSMPLSLIQQSINTINAITSLAKIARFGYQKGKKLYKKMNQADHVAIQERTWLLTELQNRLSPRIWEQIKSEITEWTPVISPIDCSR